MSKGKTKIYINCSGGLVQEVLCSSKNVSVVVCDYDDYDEDPYMKRKCNRMAKLADANEIYTVW